MTYDINDEWAGSFRVTELGGYLYTVRAWVDPFATWQSDLRKKMEADPLIRRQRQEHP